MIRMHARNTHVHCDYVGVIATEVYLDSPAEGTAQVAQQG
jgi:hypothetical protein